MNTNVCHQLGTELASSLTIAFQPIVDVATGQVYAYEALARGANGEGSASLFERARNGNLAAFDAACRLRAIEYASDLGLASKLSLNVSPAAICHERYGLEATLEAASLSGIADHQLIFEITEHEPVKNIAQARRLLDRCRRRGALIAMDDFGAGYNGLGTVLELRPDIVKLDMNLARKIDSDPTRQAIVSSIVTFCGKLGIVLLAEGIETLQEMETLRKLGVELMQGYLFARPVVGELTSPRAVSDVQDSRKPSHVEARAAQETMR